MKIKIYLTFLSLCFFIKINAQWQQTNGPYGGVVNSFAIIDTNIFAGVNGGGIYLSTNNGSNWKPMNNGLTYLSTTALLISGTNIFAGTYGGVFLSVNNGN